MNFFLMVVGFFRNLSSNRSLVAAMTMRELHTRYVGTVGGIAWAVIHPLATGLIYWLVFAYGLKMRGPGGTSFIIFFMCGLAPWLMFSEVVSNSANVIVGNTHLVSKVAFPTETLPVVQLAAALIGHAVMILIVVMVVLLKGGELTVAWPQLLYYLGANMLLALGLSWLVASLNVFLRDVGQFMPVMMNIWFWVTPVVWPLDIMPSPVREILQLLNPMAYIVQGYRDSLIDGVWFWHHGWETMVFWGECLGLLALGTAVFRRLKPDFPEMV